VDRLLGKDFFETSRGRIVALLRLGALTIDELASKLKLTPNAVRAHVAVMAREGMVQRVGQRAGPTRPSQMYGLNVEVEQLLSRAYVPLLLEIVRVFSGALPAAEVERLMREVGRSLGAHLHPSNSGIGDLRSRVVAASEILNTGLGALTHVEVNGGYSICGAGCPVAALTDHHPAVCLAIESLVSELVGAPAHECCDRDGRPRCRFEFHEG
jgi:predicted ArsR family transcriptional regulator